MAGADDALSDAGRVGAIVDEMGADDELVQRQTPILWRKYAALAALPYQRELSVKVDLLTLLLRKHAEAPSTPINADQVARMQERGLNLRTLLRHYTDRLAALGGGSGDGTTGAPLEPLSGVIARDTPYPAAPGLADPWDGYLGRDGRGVRQWGRLR